MLIPLDVLPAILIASTGVSAFALLVVLTALRIRSREAVVYHLALYALLGLLLNVLQLLAAMPLGTLVRTVATDSLITDFIPLALVLTFGALTFDFLKRETRQLVVYWIAALVILVAWNVLTFNLGGGSQFLADLFSSTPERVALVVTGMGWFGAIVTAIIILILDFRKKQSTHYLNRLRYWLLATALLGVSGVVLYTSPAIYSWAGLGMFLVGSVLAGYTVLSHHTPDIKLLVGRAALYFGVVIILAMAFLATIAVAITLSRSITTQTNLILWSALLAVMMAMVFPALWQLANVILNWVIFGRSRADERQIIKRYSQSISNVLDTTRLGETLTNLMIETMSITKGVVFISEQEMRGGDITLRPLSSVGGFEAKTGYFSNTSPLITYFREQSKAVSQYDIEVLPEFQALPASERDWLVGLDMELFVAIIRQPDMIGLLAFGPKPQGTVYSQTDIDLAVAMADQAALAVDSARLFEQLSFVNQEVGTLTNQLASIDQNKTDFLSIASHELRTPLTQIQGYSRMLLDLTEDELNNSNHLKKLIEGVAKGSERMKDVVDVMFDVTEADIGGISLFKGPVNLSDVLDQATRQLLASMDERRIAYQKNGFGELPIVQADGTRLVQAMENLINNAVKYTPDGGKIEVSAHLTHKDKLGDAIELIVQDSGIGIDAEHHERVFDKFYRVGNLLNHSTGKTKFKGAGPGLGLTLVKAIAEAHGGLVWVESPGYNEETMPGSAFHFVIPLESREKAAVIEQPPVSQAQIETRHWRRSDMTN